MSIIINEFEVVPETDPPPTPERPVPLTSPAPLRPEEVMRIQERQAARLKRVWAD